MKSKRILFFILAILIGLGAGLAFGWLVLPPQAPREAALSDLRADYKTDLVLMAAESFCAHQDPRAALEQLAQIDTGDPLTLLVNSIQYAQAIGYASADLDTLRALFYGIDASVYQSWLEEQGR